MFDDKGENAGPQSTSRREFMAKTPALIAVAMGLGAIATAAACRNASASNSTRASAGTAGNLPPKTKYVFKSDPRAGQEGYNIMPG